MSAAELVGLLLVPTDPSILAAGPWGYRPPVACFCPWCKSWTPMACSCKCGCDLDNLRDLKKALVLAVDCKALPPGIEVMDRSWKHWGHAEGMVERIFEGDDIDAWDVPGDLVGIDESGRQLTGPGYGPSALLLAQVRTRSGDPSARVEYMEHPNHPGDPITPGAGWVCFAGGVLPAAGIGATSREALTMALDAFPE